MATIKYLYRSKKKTASISIRFSHKNIFNLGVNPINILDLRRVTKN